MNALKQDMEFTAVLYGAIDKISEAVVALRETERERCAAAAKDWFTLPPSMRTKENLIKMILSEDRR